MNNLRATEFVYFKWVDCVVYELYLNNALSQKKKEKKKKRNSALAGVALWIECGLQTKWLPVQFPVRHMPGLLARSPVGGAREATTH